jgi:hypothetical protein
MRTTQSFRAGIDCQFMITDNEDGGIISNAFHQLNHVEIHWFVAFDQVFRHDWRSAECRVGFVFDNFE